MSTGHMPNPPDNLTSQATNQDVKGQTAPGAQPQATTQAATGQTATDTQVEQAAPQLPLKEDVARIIEGQVGVIAQRLVYHSQMMFGVGGLGSDPVSARDATMAVADALRYQAPAHAVYSLVNLGDAQIVQVNDRTMPFRFNSQVAGLLEGILADTVSSTYKEDKARQQEARTLLNALFLAANDRLQLESKIIPMMSQASAMGTERDAITETQAGPQLDADSPMLPPPTSDDKG